MAQDLKVFYEATPNPNSMKFNLPEVIGQEQVFFDDPLQAQRSPLAQKIFGFPWASAVFIGPNFVTVSKQDWVEWEVLAEPLSQLIQEHLEAGEAVLLSAPSEDKTVDENDSDIVKQIKNILDQEIRPAVAMDGGDIQFHKYENQIVYLHLYGACAGCPSSTITLKQGVETRLKQSIPEIKEVVSM